MPQVRRIVPNKIVEGTSTDTCGFWLPNGYCDIGAGPTPGKRVSEMADLFCFVRFGSPDLCRHNPKGSLIHGSELYVFGKVVRQLNNIDPAETI